MLDPQLLTFIGAVTMLTLIPGATTMLIMRSVIAWGQSAGFFVILGSSVGVFVHAALSALGLSIILVQSRALFEAVKMLGVIYLVFLGGQSIWRALRQSPQSIDTLEQRPAVDQDKSRGRSAIEGLVTITLSPETSMFYLATLPQFIRAGESVLLQSFLLAGIHALVRIVWYSILTLSFARINTLFRRPGVRRGLELTSGVALISFALITALRRR